MQVCVGSKKRLWIGTVKDLMELSGSLQTAIEVRVVVKPVWVTAHVNSEARVLFRGNEGAILTVGKVL